MSVQQTFDVPAALATSGILPSPPGVVIDITRLVNDPDTTIEQLAAVVETDPVLTARMLGTVNSGLYALVRRIHSVPDAMVLLGFKAVRTLALGVSVAGGLPDPSACPGFDLGHYWRHSLMTAVLSRDLASHLKRAIADEAFTIGLIANIGRLVIATAVPADYGKALAANPWPDSATERQHLGFDSPTVTAALLHRWGLPDELCHAAGHVHSPEQLPEYVNDQTRFATTIVAAASTAIEHLLHPTDAAPIESIADTLATALDLDAAVTHQTLDEAADHLGDLQHLIADSLPEGLHPNELIDQAQRLLHHAAETH
ncbi:MAG: HDOD domain-containing protein [Actinomycetota bacterium]